MTSRTRLFRELKEFQDRSGASDGIEIAPDEANIFRWSAVLKVSPNSSAARKRPALLTPLSLSRTWIYSVD